MSAPRLRVRNYTVVWHWRDGDPDALLVDPIRATTVPHAIARLERVLASEYADVRARMVVVEVAER